MSRVSQRDLQPDRAKPGHSLLANVSTDGDDGVVREIMLEESRHLTRSGSDEEDEFAGRAPVSL